MEVLGITAVATELGIKPNRVRQLIYLGKLPAQKLGREWAITRADLNRFKAKKRPVGRPKKITVKVDPKTEQAMSQERIPAANDAEGWEPPY